MNGIKLIGALVAFAIINLSNTVWSEPVDTRALAQEIMALKNRLAEAESLKSRLAQLEKKIFDAGSVPAIPVEQKEEADKPEINVGGAFRFNYAYKDYSGANKDKGGDFIFDHFRLNMNVSYKDLLLSTQYRWFGYMDVIHHAWIGYNFTDTVQGQFGLTKVPFGILPYADHSYWLGEHYYMGLSDDYDLGIKFLINNDPWDIQFAFFKNADWGNPSDKDRYSVDVVTDLDRGEANEETNQVNLRIANTIKHQHGNKTEIGVSGMVGQLYNSLTKDMGSRWAAAAHLNGFYGPFNLMLEGAWYGFNPENPAGMDDSTVLLGNYGDAYLLAAEGAIYTANLSYDVPIAWGPINKLTFYNDYNILIKNKDGFADSQINIPGVMVTVGPVFTYFEAIMGKNAIFLGNEVDPMGKGHANAGWNVRYNINVGYYF